MWVVILYGSLALQWWEASALVWKLMTCAPSVGFQTMALMVAQGTVLVQFQEEVRIPQKLTMPLGERLVPQSSDGVRGNRLALLALLAPWQPPFVASKPLGWLPQDARNWRH